MLKLVLRKTRNGGGVCKNLLRGVWGVWGGFGVRAQRVASPKRASKEGLVTTDMPNLLYLIYLLQYSLCAGINSLR